MGERRPGIRSPKVLPLEWGVTVRPPLTDAGPALAQARYRLFCREKIALRPSVPPGVHHAFVEGPEPLPVGCAGGRFALTRAAGSITPTVPTFATSARGAAVPDLREDCA